MLKSVMRIFLLLSVTLKSVMRKMNKLTAIKRNMVLLMGLFYPFYGVRMTILKTQLCSFYILEMYLSTHSIDKRRFVNEILQFFKI